MAVNATLTYAHYSCAISNLNGAVRPKNRICLSVDN